MGSGFERVDEVVPTLLDAGLVSIKDGADGVHLRRGLWNLFLPAEHGTGLSNLQYASLAEITERSIHSRHHGDEYVVNGRKWWSTGAMNHNARILVVMGKTDPGEDRHRQQSMILVPRDTPGLELKRGMTAFGYDDNEHGGHAELEFHDVRVPTSNLIGNDGQGFATAQARLGPGRIHHCMRSIGVAERATGPASTRVRRATDTSRLDAAPAEGVRDRAHVRARRFRAAFGTPTTEQGSSGSG